MNYVIAFILIIFSLILGFCAGQDVGRLNERIDICKYNSDKLLDFNGCINKPFYKPST